MSKKRRCPTCGQSASWAEVYPKVGCLNPWHSEEPDSKNLEKVAQGNECSDPDFHPAMCKCPPKGSCRTCGCWPDQMPMIFRGTGWCSDRCRKQQLKKEEG